MLGGGRPAEQTAEDLLDRWPSLPELLAAPPSAIGKIAGSRTADICSAVAGALDRITRGAIEDRPLIGSTEQLHAYLRLTMAYRATEELRVLYLNAGLRLIRAEVNCEGMIDRITYRPQDILRRARQLRATGLILAHNHPGGDRLPSPADIRATAQLVELARQCDIRIHDHVIVARGGVSSMRLLGHLQDLA